MAATNLLEPHLAINTLLRQLLKPLHYNVNDFNSISN